jgi:hypothetical protein
MSERHATLAVALLHPDEPICTPGLMGGHGLLELKTGAWLV